MANVIADRVRETTTTTGTGPVNLLGAVQTFVSFTSVMSIGDTCPYYIVSQSLNEWERGIGTYSSAGVLTRTTVQGGTNGTSAVNFSAGTKDVFLMSRAADFALLTGGLLPLSLGGTNAANAATARVNLGVSAIDGTYGGDTVTSAQTITLVQYASFPFTINSLQNIGTVGGTVTGTLNINGSPVTGLSALSLTTTPANPTATAANTVSVGQKVTFVTSSASSLTGLLPFTLVATR